MANTNRQLLLNVVGRTATKVPVIASASLKKVSTISGMARRPGGIDGSSSVGECILVAFVLGRSLLKRILCFKIFNGFSLDLNSLPRRKGWLSWPFHGIFYNWFPFFNYLNLIKIKVGSGCRS